MLTGIVPATEGGDIIADNVALKIKAIVCDMRDEAVDFALSVNPTVVAEVIASMSDIVADYKAHWGVPPRPNFIFKRARENQWRGKGESGRRREAEEEKAKYEGEIQAKDRDIEELQAEVGKLRQEKEDLEQRLAEQEQGQEQG